MQGSYFHHLFLLCIWLLIKPPQLGCDAVSISGQQDRAAANQCWQKCSLAANVSRSTAKAFESPEICYIECLKKSRSHQFAGNERVRALSRRIKRDSHVSTNSTPISVEQGKVCDDSRKDYGFLPREYITVTLEYIPFAIDPPLYIASISWNVLSGLTSNWTQGYMVSYILWKSPTVKNNTTCRRLLGMNTSFTSFNITDKDLNPDKAIIYVMVTSLSHKGPRQGSEEELAAFHNAAPTSRVRTGKECGDFAETKDFIPKKNIRIELILTTNGYYNTTISWELESDWTYMIVYKLDGLVNDTRTPTFCRAVNKGTNSIRLGRLDVPNELLLANRSRILVAVTSLSNKSHGTERVRNGSQYQIANFSDAIIPSTLPTETVSTSPNVTIDPSITNFSDTIIPSTLPTETVSTSPNVTIDPSSEYFCRVIHIDPRVV